MPYPCCGAHRLERLENHQRQRALPDVGFSHDASRVQSSTIQPSRRWMMREPYEAFTSECVTWMMVVPASLSVAEQLHDFLALRRVQVAGRLVGEDDLGVGDHRARHADQLLLAARQLARIQVLLPDNLKPVEDVGHHALPILAADVPVRERDLEILVHRQVVEQVIALEHEPDVLLVELGALLRVQPVDGLAEEVDTRPTRRRRACRGCAAASTCPRPTAP